MVLEEGELFIFEAKVCARDLSQPKANMEDHFCRIIHRTIFFLMKYAETDCILLFWGKWWRLIG